jgi:isopentenyl diphosphate isomerase/L-lactate dehydrogenase-like FMN-dependent dehydrogenase
MIKGVQCVEVRAHLLFYLTANNSFQDAEKAFEYGVQGIVLSNHGGRQLDLLVRYLSS